MEDMTSDAPAGGEGSVVAGGMSYPINLIPNEESVYSYMGLSVQFPQNLLAAVLNKRSLCVPARMWST